MTAQQKAAVRSRSPDILLDAGAGTGKTRVIVERYCDLICRDGLAPEEILAFTFTDRAAAQLRERIRAELTARADQTADPELGLRLGEILSGFGAAAISTIHGFCHRLLARHPVAAGIDPRFRVLERSEAERAARIAFDVAVARFLEGPGPGQREATLAAYRVDGMRSLVSAAHTELRSRGHAKPRLPELSAADPAQLEAALAEVEACASAALGAGGGSESQRVKMEMALELAAARGSELAKLDELAPLNFPATGPREECAKAIRKATVIAAALEEGDTAYRHIAELVELFDRSYAEVKAARSGLDFEDLQLLAVDLLRSSPDVRELHAGRLRHLMVDEFQDTNALQLELIEALRGTGTALFLVGDELQGIYGFRHADVEVFRDEKRRIATGGEVLPLSGNFRSRPEIIAAVNRFGELLLGSGYTALEPAPEAAVPEAAGEGPAVEILLVSGSGWGEEQLDLPVDDRTRPCYVAEARNLAARLRSLADDGVPLSEMVVLLRAYTRVDAYEEALQRSGLRPYVVGGRGYWSRQQVEDARCLLAVIANPLDDEALLGALSSPACGISPDSLWLLRAAAGRRRHLWPALSTLAGSWEAELEAAEWLDHVPGSDRAAAAGFHARIEELRDSAPLFSLEELTERALTLTGYDLATLMRAPGHMRAANLRKLARLAREFEQREGRDLRGFLDFIELSGDLDAEAVAATAAEGHDGVRIMTIHSAKGLEFGVVAVPDLDRGLLVGGFPPDLRLGPDPEGGMRVGMRLARLGAGSLQLHASDELREEADRAGSEEALRLFHVATTRAERRLILSGVFPEKAKDIDRPGTAVIHRLIAGLEVDPSAGDGTIAVEDGAIAVSVTAGGPEQARRLRQRSSGPATAAALGTGPPPLADTLDVPVSLPPLSYSAISSHQRCGYRFYAERVLRLDPDPPGEGEGGRPERFGFGTAVHSLLEWSAARSWIEPAEDLVRATLTAEGLDPDRDRLEDRIRSSISGWTSSSLCAQLGAEGTQLRAEVSLLLELGGAVVRGSIDLLAEPAGGPPLVIDYKTDRLGERSPAERAEDYAIQRRLYAVAAAAATAAESVQVAYVFLEKPDQPVVETYGPAGLEAARTELEAAVAEIASGSFPVTPEPDWPLCHDCPARARLCPAPAAPPGREPAAVSP